VLDGEHDLLGRGSLLLAGKLDLAAHLGHGPHHRQPALHLLDALLQGHHGLAALHLGAFDELGDLGGGALGAFGQAPDLVRDDGEATTGIAGARGFDGRVQGEQVGLVRDVIDQLEDALDLIDATGKGQRSIARRAQVGLSELEVGLRLSGLGGDTVDGIRDCRRGACDLLHAVRPPPRAWPRTR